MAILPQGKYLFPQGVPGTAPTNIGQFFPIPPPFPVSAPAPIAAMYNRIHEKSLAIMIMDVIPDYVEKTFLMKDGMINGYMPYIKIGGALPERLDSAVVIYNTSEYHSNKAAELMNQLEDLYPGIKVVGIAVQG